MRYYVYWRRRTDPGGYVRQCVQEGLGAVHQGNGWVRQTARTVELTPEEITQYLARQQERYPWYEVRVEPVRDP